jgi:pentatricopeptide repeat protein
MVKHNQWTHTCRVFNQLKSRGIFLNSRSMDNLFLNRVITPVEDAASSEADKTRGKGS